MHRRPRISDTLSAPIRWLRWRLSGWSASRDREFHDDLFTGARYDPFSAAYPGNLTIRRFADYASERIRPADALVIDLGCGVGELTCELARRHPSTTFHGIDHSPVAIARAEALAAAHGLGNARFTMGDLETFAPEPGTDLVMMFNAFHHVLDPKAFLARVRDRCSRILLIEPAGTWLGGWEQRGDLDWLWATVLQIRERLENQFGVEPALPAAVSNGSGPSRSRASEPTEHRYTLSDLTDFFRGWRLDLKGTVAGLEVYGLRPDAQSPLRESIGGFLYRLVVEMEELLRQNDLDLAAKHWVIFAEPGNDDRVAKRLESFRLRACAPRGILPAHAATFSDVRAPDGVRRDEDFLVSVTLKNTGWIEWTSDAANPVHASYHWLNRAGEIIVADGMRTAFSACVAAGGTTNLSVRVKAPAEAGALRLVLDLVHENVCWFADEGSFPVEVVVNVA